MKEGRIEREKREKGDRTEPAAGTKALENSKIILSWQIFRWKSNCEEVRS